MVDQVAGVVLGALDEARLASTEEIHPDPVHAGRVCDDAAVVAESAPVIEHRNMEP